MNGQAGSGHGEYPPDPDFELRWRGHMKKRTVVILLLVALAFCSSISAQSIKESGGSLPVQKGSVKEIETYGHALLDITIKDFLAAGYELGDTVDVVFNNGYSLTDIPFFNGYYVQEGEPLLRAYPGDTNIAVCINYGNLSEVAGISAGAKVEISLNKKAAALDTQTLNSLAYSNNREDYSSDEVFANFREITAGNIKPGKLYRSASPFNSIYNRAPYVNALAEQAGIKGILDLADTEEDIKAYFEQPDFKSFYAKSLFENGAVAPLGMPVDYASEEFSKKLVSGIAEANYTEGPILINCTEGKDRTGFVSALAEALMGATYEEIVDDYMKSFENYYGLTKESDPQKYAIVVKNNIDEMLRFIAGVDASADLAKADLSSGARKYLTSNGMTDAQVDLIAAYLGD